MDNSRRVMKFRANHRFQEIRPKLLRLQEMVGEMSRKKLESSVPGLKPELLDEIIGGRKDLKDLSHRIKYKNRKIIIEADLSKERPYD